jgi:hypothetical protein
MSRTGRLGVWLTLGAVCALLLGSPSLSWAHVDPPATLALDQIPSDESQASDSQLPSTHPISPAIAGTPPSFMLFALLAVTMAQVMWRWRRAAALALILALGVFTLGTAIHSVHHLSEPAKAAECPVFAAAQHVPGSLAEPGDLYAPGLGHTETSCNDSEVPTFTPYYRPAQPRAPPLLPI